MIRVGRQILTALQARSRLPLRRGPQIKGLIPPIDPYQSTEHVLLLVLPAVHHALTPIIPRFVGPGFPQIATKMSPCAWLTIPSRPPLPHPFALILRRIAFLSGSFLLGSPLIYCPHDSQYKRRNSSHEQRSSFRAASLTPRNICDSS